MLLRILTAASTLALLASPTTAQRARQSDAPVSRDVAAAQAAAWGRPGSTTYRIDNDNVRFSGGRLVQTRFGPVLVAAGAPKEFGHPTPGYVGAFYLKRTPRGYARDRGFEKAVVSGSAGNVGEWSISNAFAANPVIYTEGGFSNMGSTCSYTSLTELTPRGPVEIARFQSYGDNNGSGPGQRAFEVKGRIANIVRGRSFDVVFTGTRAGRDRYVWSGGKYRLAGGRPHLDSC